MEPVKIILADDEPLLRLDLRTMLEQEGYMVVGEAGDGRQAVEITRSLRPDLAILDIMMPQMNGLDAARAIRDADLAAVLVLSGYGQRDVLDRADAAGVQAFLNKPIRKDDLMSAVPLAVSRFRERLRLQAEVTELKEKMEARKVVGRAKALLMERYNLTEREAFYRIQAKSQMLQKPAHEIAQAIITASELGV
jgi:response regulator NasT